MQTYLDMTSRAAYLTFACGMMRRCKPRARPQRKPKILRDWSGTLAL